MPDFRLAPPHLWITVALSVLGVAIPIAALIVELDSHVSMAMGIDPLPSLAHVILVGAVPAFLACALIGLHGGPAWHGLRTEHAWVDRGLGCAQGIALGYAAALWPLTWIGAWVAGLGWILLLGPDGDDGAKALIPLSWLALAPALSFIAGLITRWRWRRRHPSARAGRFRWPMLGLASLFLAELPSLALHVLVERDWQLPVPESALLRAHDLGLDSVGLLHPASSGQFWRSRDSPSLGEGRLLRQTGRLRAAFGRLSLPGRDSANQAVGDWVGFNDRARADFRTELPMTSIEWTESQIHAQFHPDFGSAYLEWTFVIRNRGSLDQEARAQIQLPPGASVSRATLWVDGVPREAAVGKRSSAVEAYRSVVRVRRDPLLITSQGVDRVFLNAFPIPADDTMRFRLGISVPLHVLEPGQGAQFLPRLGARSFGSAAGLQHEVSWEVEPGKTISWAQLGSKGSNSPDPTQARFSDEELRRGVIAIARSQGASETPLQLRDLRGAPLPGLQVSTTPVPGSAELPVVLVVDGSRALADHAVALADWLEADHGRPILGVVLAGEARSLLAPSEAAGLLRRSRWTRGSDNGPSLKLAARLAQEGHAELVWIRGPQLFEGHDLTALWSELCPAAHRCHWTELAVTPSPDPFDGQRKGGSWLALPFTGNFAADLDRIDRDWAREIRGFRVDRTRSREARGLGTEPAAIQTARLIAREEILRAGPTDPGRAIDLARRYELVSPWSGAVVLETDPEYARSGLETPRRQPDDPGALDPGAAAGSDSSVALDDIAAPIPEPGSALLFALGCLLLRHTGRGRSVGLR